MEEEIGKTEQEKFVMETIRPLKRGVFQENIAHYLSLVVSAPPLKKVRLTCEASLMLNDKQLKKLEIDKEAVETIHQVCTCLRTAVKTRSGLTMIRWGFPPVNQNYRRYIKPWLVNNDFDFYYRYREESGFGGDRVITDLPKWVLEIMRRSEDKVTEKDLSDLFFWATSSRLTMCGFTDLCNQFVSWSLPQTQKVCQKLTRLVHPDIYRDVLALMKGETVHAHNVDKRQPKNQP